MRGSPDTWEPITWGVIALGALVVLLQLPVWVSDAVMLMSVFGLVQLNERQRDEVAEDFRNAVMHDTPLGLVNAARHMGINDSDLGKMLRGGQRFDIWRIEMLPEETQRCFYFRRAQRKGLPTFICRALKIVPAFQVDMERAG
jgi:hypothetical protein